MRSVQALSALLVTATAVLGSPFIEFLSGGKVSGELTLLKRDAAPEEDFQLAERHNVNITESKNTPFGKPPCSIRHNINGNADSSLSSVPPRNDQA